MHTTWFRGALGGLLLAHAGCFRPTDIEQEGDLGGTETDDAADTGQDGPATQSGADGSASQDGPSTAEGSADDDGTGTDPTSPTTADPTADGSESGGDSGSSDDVGEPTTATDPTTSDPTGDPTTDVTDTTGDDTGRCMPQCGAQECGEDPVCGEACGGCDLGETCLDDGEWCGTDLGQPDDLGFSGDVNPNVLFGHRITVAEAVDVRRFGVIADGPGTARMALYAHDGEGPGLLIAESDEIDLAAGNNEGEISPIAILPGTYWIAIVVEATASLRRTANGDDSHELFYAVLDYDAVMPASLVSDAVVNDLLYNLYVVVDDDD